jgi:hypothetical protein
MSEESNQEEELKALGDLLDELCPGDHTLQVRGILEPIFALSESDHEALRVSSYIAVERARSSHYHSRVAGMLQGLETLLRRILLARGHLRPVKMPEETIEIRLVSSGNIPLLNGLTFLDTVRLRDGDWVLLTCQQNPAENGVYIWNKSDGMLSLVEVPLKHYAKVEEGSCWSNTLWMRHLGHTYTLVPKVYGGGDGEDE